MSRNVARQEIQKLSKHGIIDIRYLSSREHNFAASANGVVNFVPLTQAEGAANSFWHPWSGNGQLGWIQLQGWQAWCVPIKNVASFMVMQSPCLI